MLSNKEIVCPNNLLDQAHKKKGVNAAIVNETTDKKQKITVKKNH